MQTPFQWIYGKKQNNRLFSNEVNEGLFWVHSEPQGPIYKVDVLSVHKRASFEPFSLKMWKGKLNLDVDSTSYVF